MASIEQVSKRLFSDSRWFVKVFIGGLLMLLPTVITQILALGYLYRLFLQGKEREAFALPEWEDWKGFFKDGVMLFLIALVFCVVPMLAVTAMTMMMPGDRFLESILLVPALFLCWPATCASFYLFSVKSDLKDAFAFETVWLLIKRAAPRYSAPTLAMIGLWAFGLPVSPFALFFGSTIYLYFMASAFKELESGR